MSSALFPNQFRGHLLEQKAGFYLVLTVNLTDQGFGIPHDLPTSKAAGSDPLKVLNHLVDFFKLSCLFPQMGQEIVYGGL